MHLHSIYSATAESLPWHITLYICRAKGPLRLKPCHVSACMYVYAEWAFNLQCTLVRAPHNPITIFFPSLNEYILIWYLKLWIYKL